MSSDTRQAVNGLYTLGQTIGTGHFAVVKLARHVFTQEVVAVKVIDKTKLDEISKAHLFQEVMCMKLVQHPNVVRLYEVIDTPNKLYLILEYADGGDMYDYIMKHSNGLSESLARRYFQQICRALKYCHEVNVCHRDLKPENLVFFEKQGLVKLTDFGFSNQFAPGKKLLTSCGSLAYSSPEILLGDPYDAEAVDIWSLGVILFMLVTGRAPFQEANDSETVMMILDCCYKLPPNVSVECQNLIHQMIVREPEKRATLDEVMSHIWYRQNDDDDEYDDMSNEIDSLKSISSDYHQSILHQMIDGNIAEQETILKALKEEQYNHITATYHLLAAKLLHDNHDDDNHRRNIKRQKRSLQAANDRVVEQIGVFIPSSSNSGKENIPPMSSTPKHSVDSSSEQTLSAVFEDDEEQPSLQPRPTNTNPQTMNMILEEDENPESPPTDKTDINLLKLNKIVESEDEETKISTTNPTNPSENATTTSGILRSKDLRSVIEMKRRNISRSCSNSDSEDNDSNSEMNRLTNRKLTYTPTSLNEFESSSMNHRGRSFSNIEHVLHENPSNSHQQIISMNNNASEPFKRRSFSRTSSIISTNRLILTNNNDDNHTDTSLGNSSTVIHDRTRSLSVDHRLGNPSQMSIASKTSIRFTTPRESTVFTKTEAPAVVRLIQQTHHQDTNDVIKTLIEHQRRQSIPSQHDSLQAAIIVEEDLSPPLVSFVNTNIKSPLGKKTSNTTNKSNPSPSTMETIPMNNGHISSNSVLSTLKYSLIKHQQQRKSINEKSSKRKQKNSTNKHRGCCTIS